MEIDDVRSLPTVINGVHESCYKSYQELELMKKMLRRWDSRETILEIISFIEN